MYKVVASGSKGNCVIYFDTVAVDMGIPFEKIKPYLHDLSLVAITHKHLDHMNLGTLKKLADERPSLRFGIHKDLIPFFEGFGNVDVYDTGKWYDYGKFKIATGRLYHDCENRFYRFDFNGYKIFHATDSSHLEKITAPKYNLYCIEANYDEERVYDVIHEKRQRGEYAHQVGAINSHLSIQQARNFVLRNGIPGQYTFVPLHQSAEF